MDFDLDRATKKFDQNQQRHKRTTKAAQQKPPPSSVTTFQSSQVKEELQLLKTKLREEREAALFKDNRNNFRPTSENEDNTLWVLKGIKREQKGDRMNLPPSVLQSIVSNPSFSSPFYFKISVFDNEDVKHINNEEAEHDCEKEKQEEGEGESQIGVITYGGVLEFTSNEGEVSLPQKVTRNLQNFKENANIKLELTSLPTATYVKFAPLASLRNSASFSAIKNPKARLESSLSYHVSTLSVGDIVEVDLTREEGGGKEGKCELEVIELKANENDCKVASIVDTDLIVDLDYPSSFSTTLPSSSSSSSSSLPLNMEDETIRVVTLGSGNDNEDYAEVMIDNEENKNQSKWRIYQINMTDRVQAMFNANGEIEMSISVNNFFVNSNNGSLVDFDFYIIFSEREVCFPFYPSDRMTSSISLPISASKLIKLRKRGDCNVGGESGYEEKVDEAMDVYEIVQDVHISSFYIAICRTNFEEFYSSSSPLPLPQFNANNNNNNNNSSNSNENVCVEKKENYKFCMKIKERSSNAKMTIDISTNNDNVNENIKKIEGNDDDEDGRKICSNCNQRIPIANYQMHQLHCARNVKLCSIEACPNKIIKRSEVHLHCPLCSHLFHSEWSYSLHLNLLHEDQVMISCDNNDVVNLEKRWRCPTCSEAFLFSEIKLHSLFECKKRRIRCMFCEDFVQSEGKAELFRDYYLWKLSNHESRCGNRTISCHHCYQPVRMKEYSFHTQTFHPLHSSTNLISVIPSKVNYNVGILKSEHSDAMVVDVDLGDNHSGGNQSNTELETFPSNEENNGGDDENMTLECPICTERFISERVLNSHLDTVHF